jgi:hypothetical protein
MKTEKWISFKEKKPLHKQYIWLKQDEYTERAIYYENGNIELILPQHKKSSIITKPTHWSEDTY